MGKKSKRRSTEEVLEDTGKALAPTDPVSQYLAEIRKYPLLDREEERRIAEHYYETGDQKSAEILVTSNLRFVVKIAAEYAKFGAKLIDLIQEGNIGLMQGVREFNPYKGVRLISYAVWWIRGYIQEYLMRQYSLVRIGTTHNQRKLFYQLQKERDELERMGVEAGIKQLSGRLGISEGEIRSMNQRLTGRDVSLSVPTGTDQSNSTLLDMQADESLSDVDSFIGQNEEINILRNSIKDLRPELNPREIEILDKRILADDPLTLQEIGDLNNTTREAVRQMEARLLKKIKRAVAQQNLIETED
ncbi:MAG: RNA polymerase factor sigma-32 [Bdellovibrionales bacterium]|nr:RNA polymerase factor sigma-32 [Bdellovibrionales bacterium]